MRSLLIALVLLTGCAIKHTTYLTPNGIEVHNLTCELTPFIDLGDCYTAMRESCNGLNYSILHSDTYTKTALIPKNKVSTIRTPEGGTYTITEPDGYTTLSATEHSFTYKCLDY